MRRFQTLGLMVVFCIPFVSFLSVGVVPANAGMLHGEMTSQRVITPPIPNAGGTATIFGSVRATADADGNAGTTEILRQAKLTAAGGPPATLVTNNVLAIQGPRVSPIVAGTTAFSRALIDVSNSALTPPMSQSIADRRSR